MIKIYNTMAGQKEDFEPLGDPVKMYVCGVTPYDQSHIGHAMSYIVFDVIRRYLEFRGYNLRFVQNFTDVDDKLIARAQRLKTSVKEVAEKYIAEYLDDMASLNVKPPTLFVRATDTIDKILDVTAKLVEKGFAYAVDGDVYYRVTYKDDYGKLSHRVLDDMQAGARVEIGGQKEHPMDFVLWKSAKPGEPSWESPWGPGRPGWHIECSAMILEHLGDQIDIHGGGHDLIFPHHENEIAQSESYTDKKPFAKYWIHNGLLQLGEEKMSKSLGNLVTIREALDMASADALRAFFLSSHYRAPLTYTDEGLMGAERGIERLRAAIHDYDPSIAPTSGPLADAAAKAREHFIAVMDDDLNTSAAVATLYDLVREINRARETGASASELAPAQATLKELTGVLGFTMAEGESSAAAEPFVDLLISIRTDLRAAKQWALADKIRDELAKLGVTLEDKSGGATTWKMGRRQ